MLIICPIVRSLISQSTQFQYMVYTALYSIAKPGPNLRAARSFRKDSYQNISNTFLVIGGANSLGYAIHTE